MQCKANKCERPATVDVFWPGQHTQQCDEHAAHAKGIAKAMGFELVTRPLEDEAACD